MYGEHILIHCISGLVSFFQFISESQWHFSTAEVMKSNCDGQTNSPSPSSTSGPWAPSSNQVNLLGETSEKEVLV